MLTRRLREILNKDCKLQNAIRQLRRYKKFDSIQLYFLTIEYFLSILRYSISLEVDKYFKINTDKFFNIK